MAPDDATSTEIPDAIVLAAYGVDTSVTPRQKALGVLASVAALVVAIGLVLFGHGRLSVVFFLASGIGLGLFGPPTDSSGIHGASDST